MDEKKFWLSFQGSLLFIFLLVFIAKKFLLFYSFNNSLYVAFLTISVPMLITASYFNFRFLVLQIKNIKNSKINRVFFKVYGVVIIIGVILVVIFSILSGSILMYLLWLISLLLPIMLLLLLPTGYLIYVFSYLYGSEDRILYLILVFVMAVFATASYNYFYKHFKEDERRVLLIYKQFLFFFAVIAVIALVLYQLFLGISS